MRLCVSANLGGGSGGGGATNDATIADVSAEPAAASGATSGHSKAVVLPGGAAVDVFLRVHNCMMCCIADRIIHHRIEPN